MKRRKNVTDKVIAANQKNAEASTGPTTERGKRASRGNATKHGLTGKVIVPEANPENPDYQQVLERWWNDFQPQNIWEEGLVREIVWLGIKISAVDKSLDLEMANFLAEIRGGNVLGSINGIFTSKLMLPIDEIDLPIQRGFNCERITVRASSTQHKIQIDANRGPLLDPAGQPKPGYQMRGGNDNDGTRLEFQAELVDTLDKLRRYRTTFVKDRYRAMEALRVAKEDRREREG